MSTLRAARLQRAIGVIYRPQTERQSHYFHSRVADQFDAVIHIDETRVLEPLERTCGGTSASRPRPIDTRCRAMDSVRIPVAEVTLSDGIGMPDAAHGVVVFARGSASSRHSPRNRCVAYHLRQTGLTTCSRPRRSGPTSSGFNIVCWPSVSSGWSTG